MALGTDLFALYHFENDWTDATGNGNDGTATGATFDNSIVKLGTYSGNFDGNDKVQILNGGSDPTDFNVTELTIFDWYYYEANSTYDVVVAKRTGANNGNWQLHVINSTKKLEFQWYTAGAWRGVKTSTGTLTLNDWNFIGVRFSTVNLEVEFIIDNNIETPQAVTHGLDTTTRDVHISWDTGTSYSHGRHDELAFYDVLKSDTDVSDYWNGGSGQIITPGAAGLSIPVAMHHYTKNIST